jgi:hypothetical protein
MSNKTKPKDAAGEAKAAALSKSETEANELKAEQDALLTEALEETFPASDAISSLRFTRSKPGD